MDPDLNIEALFGKLLGELMSPAGMQAFGPLLAKMLRSYAPGLSGMSTDMLWNMMPFSERGGFGVYQQMQRAMSQGVVERAMAPVIDSTRQQYFVDIARTMTSAEDFKRLGKDQTNGMSYEQYIQHKAMGMTNNPLWGMMYNWVDPTGAVAFNKGMTGVYQNIVAKNPFGLLGSRDVYGAAADVVSGMFRDEEGNFKFNEADYGGYSKGAVSTLMAELSRSTDILEGVDVTKSNDVKNATERFRKRVQEYTKALEPLKAVFGNDMAKMISTLESITGTSIANVSTARIEDLTGRVATGQMMGLFTPQNIAELAAGIGQAMERLNIKPTDQIYRDQQAVTTLSLDRGAQLNFLTPEYQKRETMRHVFNAANSPMADSVAKAFSIWEHNMLAGNKPASFADFQKLVDEQMATNGGNMAKAIMAVAGVTNKFQLEEGTAYGGYRRAKDSQDAANMVIAQAANKEFNKTATALAQDATLRTALGEQGRRTNFDLAQNIRAVETLLTTNPDLMNMDDAERAKALQQMMAKGTIEYTVNGETRTLDLSKAFGKDVNAVNAVIEKIKNTQPETANMIRTQYNREQFIKADKERREVSEAVKKIQAQPWKNAKDFADFLVKNHGDTEALKAQIKTQGALGLDLTKEGQRQALALYEGLALESSAEYNRLTGDNILSLSESERQELFKRMEQITGIKDIKAGSSFQRAYNSEKWQEYRKQAAADAERRRSETLQFYLTDPRANTELMRSERRRMAELKDSNASDEAKRRSAARMQLLKDINADKIDAYVKDASIGGNETAGMKEGDAGYADAAIRDAIVKNGGDVGKLSEAQQKRAREMGYGDDKARNVTQAKLDRLNAVRARGGSVEGVINRNLVASKIKGLNAESQGNVKEFFEEFYKWADKETGGRYDSDSMAQFMQSNVAKDKKFTTATREQATNIMNQVSPGSQAAGSGSQSDILGIMRVMRDVLQQIATNTSKDPNKAVPKKDNGDSSRKN